MFVEGNLVLPGSPGDVIVSLTSSINIPVIRDIISFYAGGHAALCTDDYCDYFGSSNTSTIIEAPLFDAASISSSPISVEHVMLRRTPRAPSIDV